MFGSKSRKIAELQARVEQLVDELDEAHEAARVHKHARRVAEEQLACADAANKRLHSRNRHLAALLEVIRGKRADAAPRSPLRPGRHPVHRRQRPRRARASPSPTAAVRAGPPQPRRATRPAAGLE